jgi:hypothetical protein
MGAPRRLASGQDRRGLLEVIRLVELGARIHRYQRDMLRVPTEWQQTTVDEVLTRPISGSP